MLKRASKYFDGRLKQKKKLPKVNCQFCVFRFDSCQIYNMFGLWQLSLLLNTHIFVLLVIFLIEWYLFQIMR